MSAKTPYPFEIDRPVTVLTKILLPTFHATRFVVIAAALSGLSFARPSLCDAGEQPGSTVAHDAETSPQIEKSSLRRLVHHEPARPGWQYRAINVYFATFAFVIGACIGSFLNVVIYRLPLAMGLLRADSHCPVCKMPIAFKDNVPIFGWIKLRGRCRECAVRISPRYMLVELGTAVLFLMIAGTELLTGGANLPGHASAGTGMSGLAVLKFDVIAILLSHCFLASTLLCCVLIVADGHDLPARLILPALAVGLLNPYRAAGSLSLPANWPWPTLTEAVAGLIIGALLGTVLGIAERYDAAGDRRQRALMLVLGLIGCYLGWDVSLFAAAATAVGMIALAMSAQRFPWLSRIPAIAVPALAAVMLIPVWSTVAASSWWPQPEDGLPWMAAAFAILLLVSLLIRRVRLSEQLLDYGAPS